MLPAGEKVVISERVATAPGARLMLQLSPAPLSWSSSHSQKSVKLRPAEMSSQTSL